MATTRSGPVRVNGQQLSVVECRNRLAEARIGRAVFTDQAMPTAMPVPYVLDEDSVVFRTPASGRLAHCSAHGSVVAFQVDDVDDLGEGSASGWTVLVVGLAQLVPPEGAPAWPGWRPQAANEVYVRVPFSRVSGCTLGAPVSGTTDA